MDGQGFSKDLANDLFRAKQKDCAKLMDERDALAAENDRLRASEEDLLSRLAVSLNENERLRALLEKLSTSLASVHTLAERTMFDCDPPVNFIGEIHDEASLSLTRFGNEYPVLAGGAK